MINSFDPVLYMELSTDLQLAWKNYKNINSFGSALYMEISLDLPVTR